MSTIQIITDGHPQNTTLIIDGVDITDAYEVGKISLVAFGQDPEFPGLPYFRLEYDILEIDPNRPREVKKTTQKIIVLPDDAGAMQR